MRDGSVVVVGAGPAGIAAALALKDNGLRPVVVDRADEVGSSWRGRYERLRLNTSRLSSHLPGRRFPKGTPTFPSRDQVIAHLERHAAEDGIELRLGTTVERIDRSDGGWSAATSAGPIESPQVIVATGFDRVPVIPEWPGRDHFEGELIHAAEYRNPERFAGRSVLVVGPGCSGMEIAYDLATGGAANVRLSARTPPNIVLRTGPGGLPGDAVARVLMRFPIRVADAVARVGRRTGVGDLTGFGLPVPEEGVFARLKRTGMAPAIVDEEVIEAIKDGRIEIVRGVESLEPRAVALAGGGRVEADAVIAATGYRRGLEPLVGHLGVLDERGRPKVLGPRAAAPGLRFVGYFPRPAMIGYSAKEAVRAAKAIVREATIAGPG